MRRILPALLGLLLVAAITLLVINPGADSRGTDSHATHSDHQKYRYATGLQQIMGSVFGGQPLDEMHFAAFGSISTSCGPNDCFFKPIMAPAGFFHDYLAEFQLAAAICHARWARVGKAVGAEWHHPTYIKLQQAIDRRLRNEGLDPSPDYSNWVFSAQPLWLPDGMFAHTGCPAG